MPSSGPDSRFPASSSRISPHVKKLLSDAGLEVFRSRGEEVILAERPRDNLILDSGVRLLAREPPEVRVVLRAQRSDFPHEDEAALFARARKLGASARAAGFSEIETAVSPVQDPGDPQRTLDVFYEVVLGKPAADLDAALADLKFALALEKRAMSTAGGPA